MNFVDKYDYFIFDLDGTIYRGEHLIPKADQVINHLKELNKKVVFVSNKTTGTAKDYFSLLKNWGLNIDENEVINSTIVASNYLKQNFSGETFFAIGENTNYLYRAYRYPYEWIPQVDEPEQIPIRKIDCSSFRVPGSVDNRPQNVSVFDEGDEYANATQFCIVGEPKSEP